MSAIARLQSYSNSNAVSVEVEVQADDGSSASNELNSNEALTPTILGADVVLAIN